MSTRHELGELDNATLASLVFELASQLHIERAFRLALEAALMRRGLLQRGEIEGAANDTACRDAALQAADLSVRKLVRALSESPDERAPLRAEVQDLHSVHK